MTRAKYILMGLLLILFTAGLIQAQVLVIYPAKGQSAEQMDHDKYECYTWGKQQSGFDPMAPPTTETAAPQQQAQTSSPVKGAARGAVVGVTVGAITNNSKSRSAAAGAAAGGLVGGMKKRDQAKQQQQAEQEWAQKETANYTQKREGYNKAFSACLEGKGYTVK